MFGTNSFGTYAFIAGLCLAVCGTAPAQVMGIDADGASRMICTAAENASALPVVRRKSSLPAIYREVLQEASEHYAISIDLLDTLAHQESNYNQHAVSPKGAVGIMQLMPATARALGVDAFNAEQNIMGGAAYLRYLLDVYDGRIDLALGAYNAGQKAVARYGGIPPFPETRAYLARNFEDMAKKSETDISVVARNDHFGAGDAYYQDCR